MSDLEKKPLLSETSGSAASKAYVVDQNHYNANEDHHHSAKNKSSAVTAVYHIVCVIAGVGILQLPNALKNAGWIGVAVIIYAAWSALYTGKLLIECLYYDGVNRLHGFPEIGQASFGKFGLYLVHFFQKFTLLGVCTIFLILSGIFLGELIPQAGLSDKIWTLICGGAVLIPVVLFKSLQKVKILSLIGVLASLAIVFVVVIVSLLDLSAVRDRANNNSTLPVDDTNGDNDTILAQASNCTYIPPHWDVVNWSTSLVSAFSSIIFSFGGNAVYPHVEHGMAAPQNFNKALTAAIGICLAMYLPTAIVGYHVYGSSLEPGPILETLPRNESGQPTAAVMFAMAFIVGHVLSAYPIPMVSVVLEFEDKLGIDVVKLSKSRELLYRALFRLAFVGLTVMIACLVPYFGILVDLIGAFANGGLVLILPVLFHFKLFGMLHGGVFHLILKLIILVTGFFACTGGFSFALIDLINAIQGVERECPSA